MAYDRKERSGTDDEVREAARERLRERRAASGEAGAQGRRKGPLSSREDEALFSGRNRAVSFEGEPPSRRRRSSSHTEGADIAGIHLPRAVIIAAGVIVLVLLFLGVGFIERSCAGSAEVANPQPVQTVDQGGGEAQPEPEQADFSNLPETLDAKVVEALRAQGSDERIVRIVNNASALGMDGVEQEEKLLKLAAEDPEAIQFVLDLPDRYPAEAGEPYEGPVTKGTIPLLMQWDQRWGYVRYCGTTLGTTGCAPTSLSMVYMGLTGNADKTPYDFAVMAEDRGYAVDGEGTVGEFLVAVAPELGLQCEQFTPSESSLRTYLESGYVVICNVGPGDFTTSGHFFVATGLDGEGKVTVNDPYSSTRSAQTWDVSTIANQGITFYAFRSA